METKTHFKKLRNPNYIGSYELMTGGTPTELTVTIEKSVKETIQNGDKKEEAMVIYLKGHKPMIVNSTNAKAISSCLGSPYIEDWVGKKIVLYVAKVKAFGETLDALRVKKEPISLPILNDKHPKWNDAITALKSGNTTIEKIKLSYQVSEIDIKHALIENDAAK